jgi:hypothetical protein
MDLYQSIIDDDELLDYFCDILEDNISKKKGYRVNNKKRELILTLSLLF